MSAAPDPRDPREAQRWSEGPPLPRWALWLMLPGIAGPALIFTFIVLTERAHDAGACPFRELTRATLSDGAQVIEHGRSCVAGVEERRFQLVRGGRTRLLGERRFDAADFASDRYRWEAKLGPKGEATVRVHNEGHPDLILREGTTEERARDDQE
jgi:hypothetical protein